MLDLREREDEGDGVERGAMFDVVDRVEVGRSVGREEDRDVGSGEGREVGAKEEGDFESVDVGVFNMIFCCVNDDGDGGMIADMKLSLSDPDSLPDRITNPISARCIFSPNILTRSFMALFFSILLSSFLPHLFPCLF